MDLYRLFTTNFGEFFQRMGCDDCIGGGRGGEGVVVTVVIVVVVGRRRGIGGLGGWVHHGHI